MPVDKTLEGISAIIIIFIFIGLVIPALIEATGISFWWMIPSLFLMIIGIVFAVIKEWVD